MTREEAEEYAKEMTYRNALYNALQGKCIPYRKATLIKLHELLDMVERQEKEREGMTDYQKYINALRKYAKEHDNDTTYTGHIIVSNLCRDTANLLEELGQEPKTGHWIGHGEHCRNLGIMPSGLGAYEWCSNCDCGIDVREWHRNKYNYCPNCGAKMVEPQEGGGVK